FAASAGLLVGVATGGETFNAFTAMQAAIPLGALGICCFSLTFLLAQFASARNATAVAGVILLALFLVNSLSRTFDFLVRWRPLSPFHYYELSAPLTPYGTLDARATFTLVAFAIASTALAAVAFRYRDVGSPLINLPASATPASYEMSTAIVWRIPVIRDLWDRRVSLLIWAAGLSALGAVFVVLTQSGVQPLLSVPALTRYFSSFLTGDVYASFLGYIWFGFAQL